MTQYEEYRKQAKEAHRQADESIGMTKTAWLAVMEGWLRLLPLSEREKHFRQAEQQPQTKTPAEPKD